MMEKKLRGDVNVSELPADLHQLAQEMLKLSDLLLQALIDDDTSRVTALNTDICKINEAIQRLATEKHTGDPGDPADSEDPAPEL